MLKANGLIMIPEDQEVARVGEKVSVQLLGAPFKSSE
jgi:molybdopterin biosynthesis enzyme